MNRSGVAALEEIERDIPRMDSCDGGLGFGLHIR